MKTVADVLNGCLAIAGPLEPLDMLLTEAVGCVLARDVMAPFDRPLVPVAACDGYAVRSEHFARASRLQPVHGRVVGTLRNDGQVTMNSVVDEDAPTLIRSSKKRREESTTTDMRMLPAMIGADMYRINAGGPLPEGADAVIALEATDMGGLEVRVAAPVRPGDNIVPAGADVAANSIILRAGTRIEARHVALLAGVGLLRVSVHPRPRVAVISVGDELIDPVKATGDWGGADTPSVGEVFDSNGHALAVAISELGAETYRTQPIRDEAGPIDEALQRERVRADVIIVTGGMSFASSDTVREAVSRSGNVRFDQVAMAPVKRIGYGVYDAIPFFCLPADPVAALVAYEIFVRPCLRAMAGHSQLYRPSVKARAVQGWSSPRQVREFVRVALDRTSSVPKAHVLGNPSFKSLLALAQSNALAVVPEGIDTVRPGDELFCMTLD